MKNLLIAIAATALTLGSGHAAFKRPAPVSYGKCTYCKGTGCQGVNKCPVCRGTGNQGG